MGEKVVLEEAGFESAILSDAPVTIAAACFPIGDVAFGDCELEFVEGSYDLGMRDVVAEHAVDHVASFEGEACDFAVAGAGRDAGWRMRDARCWVLDTRF